MLVREIKKKKVKNKQNIIKKLKMQQRITDIFYRNTLYIMYSLLPLWYRPGTGALCLPISSRVARLRRTSFHSAGGLGWFWMIYFVRISIRFIFFCVLFGQILFLFLYRNSRTRASASVGWNTNGFRRGLLSIVIVFCPPITPTINGYDLDASDWCSKWCWIKEKNEKSWR